MSLIESRGILNAFDEGLRKFAEKKIKARDRMELVKSSVTGTLCQEHVIICVRHM